MGQYLISRRILKAAVSEIDNQDRKNTGRDMQESRNNRNKDDKAKKYTNDLTKLKDYL